MTANFPSSSLAMNLMNSFNRLPVRLDLRKLAIIFYAEAGCRRLPKKNGVLIGESVENTARARRAMRYLNDETHHTDYQNLETR
jgi:hypothetical protein